MNDRWGSPDMAAGIRPVWVVDAAIRSAMIESPRVLRLNGTIVPTWPHAVPVARTTR